MNQSELIDAVAASTGYSKTQVKATVDAIVDAKVDALKRGEDVNVSGLGIFKIQNRDQRKARNPRTGEEVIIAAHKVVKFKLSKPVLEAINRR